MQAANMADTAMGTGAGLVERGAGLLGDQARLGDTLARDYGSLAGGAMQARNQGLNLPPAQNSWIDGMFGNPVVSSAGLATASQQSGIPAWGARTPEEEDNYGEHPTDFGQ